MKGGRSDARDLALVLACVALSLWVYRSVPGGYFSPDDLIYLERARGLVPQPPGPWRYLSGVAWFRMLVPLLGADPRPYLIVNLVLHSLCVAAVYLGSRGLGAGRMAATVAAGIFGASRLHFTVLAQAVTVAEPLSLLLAIAALSAARLRSAIALPLAIVTFTAALLCKETVLLVPLLLLAPGGAPGGLGSRALRAALLLVPGAALAAYLADPRVHAAIFVNDVYARGYGANVFHNLMTLTDWTLDFGSPVPDLNATLSTTAWRTALWLPVALATLAALAWRTTRAPAVGLGWWLLTLAPVLPLLHQRYLHYLYIPLAGLTLAIGGSLEWLAGSRARPIVRAGAPRAAPRGMPGRELIGWALAAALVAANAAVSDALLADRAAGRLPTVELPSDPFLRKAETARRTVHAVREAIGSRRTRAVFVIPESGGRVGLATVFHSVLGEGLALRAVFPNLDSVAFVRHWSPAYADFDAFYSRIDGSAVAVGRGPDAPLRLASLLVRDGCIEEAREGVAAAAAAHPEDPRLRALEARLSGR